MSRLAIQGGDDHFRECPQHEDYEPSAAELKPLYDDGYNEGEAEELFRERAECCCADIMADGFENRDDDDGE